MIKIGDFNELQVLRSTSVGIFLGDTEGTEILLPNKYVPKEIKRDQMLRVFCYLDHQERPVATTLVPLIKRDNFAYLRCVDTGAIGAFMDWGLEKHLFVPFREQQHRMVVGKNYVVHCYLDEKSFRLTASTKIENFLSDFDNSLRDREKVSLLIYRKTELGWEVIINDTYGGLLYATDVFKKIEIGQRINGYIKKIREDGKLDVTLQPIGVEMLEATAQYVHDRLIAAGGFLPLHDKSSPEEIKNQLELSKKSFKKAIGVLYKERKIQLKPEGIYLVDRTAHKSS
ncbi:MAG: S1-like domain-containing RNA-binding protein [Bacteroidota bacterium]